MSAPPPTSAHYIQGGENWGSWDKIKVPWSKLKTNWKSLSYVQVVLFQNHRFLRQVAQNMKQDFIRFYMLSPCQTHVGNTKLILVWSSSPRRGRSFSLPTGHNKRSGHKKLSRNSLHIRMSHCRLKMVDEVEFWINCKRLAFLSSFSHWQVIQNKRPWCCAAA